MKGTSEKEKRGRSGEDEETETTNGQKLKQGGKKRGHDSVNRIVVRNRHRGSTQQEIGERRKRAGERRNKGEQWK